MEDNLSVVEVVSSNIVELWPHLLSAIRQASFIALDIEMSGLGEKKKLFYPEIDVRYKYIAELAHSHAPVSLGISCFRCTSASGQGEQYSVESYDLLVLSESQFCVQSNSLKFLRSHGFDFNKLVDDGLPYTPGCDLHVIDAESKKSSKLTSKGPTPSSLHYNSTSKSKVPRPTASASRTSQTQNGNSEAQREIYIKGSSNDNQPNVRALFAYIIQHPKPVVLHNGLVDLVFLYQHFYAELPKSSETFAANLCEMFPLGIYDTKYFSEFVYRDPASYLQIVYLQERLLNAMAHGEGRPSVDVNFGSTFSSLPGLRQFCLQSKLQQQTAAAPLCISYAYHGWCELGELCPASHDLQRIVRQLLFKATQVGGQKLRNPARRTNAGPNSTGTSAMLMSAMKHNARHQKLMEDKNSSRSRSTAKNLCPSASIGYSDVDSRSVTSRVAAQNVTTDITNITTDVTNNTTDVTNNTTGVTNNTTGVINNTADVTDDTTDVTDDTTDVTDDTTDVTNDTTDVTNDTTDVTNDTTDVTNDTTDVTNNTTDVTNNTADVTNNTADVTNNTADVTNNTADVTNNTADVTNNTTGVTSSSTDSSIKRSANSRQTGQRCKASTAVRTSTRPVASAQPSNGDLAAYVSYSSGDENFASNTDTSSGLPPNLASNSDTSSGLPPNLASNTDTSSGLPPNLASNSDTSSGLPPNLASNTDTSSGLPPNLASNTGTSSGLSPNSLSRTSSTYLNGVPSCDKHSPVITDSCSRIVSNSTSPKISDTHISNELTIVPNNAESFTNNSLSASSKIGNVTSLTTHTLDATCSFPHVTAKYNNIRGVEGSKRSKRCLSREKECTSESDSVKASLEALGENSPRSVNVLQNGTSHCSHVRKRRLVDVPDDGCKLQYLNGCTAGLSVRDTESMLKSNGVCTPETKIAEDELSSMCNGRCKPSQVNERDFEHVFETDSGCRANSMQKTPREVGPSPKKVGASIGIGLDGDGHAQKDEKSYSDINEMESKLIKDEALTAPAVGSLSEGHSAGIDAFKTGFIFASYIRRAGKLTLAEPSSTSSKSSLKSTHPCNKDGLDSNSESCGLKATDKSPREGSGDGFTPQALGLAGEVNKVYLMGKNFPFLVRKSPFVKAYKNHVDKMKSIRVEGM